ncbi:uncharacterized protein [Macrobrachium rosenbergii]|uniref:uncharacterized protein n=1 Tax=Macrobrachium rosenbergii TaxID=79674 RepID=UPI0034D52238
MAQVQGGYQHCRGSPSKEIASRSHFRTRHCPSASATPSLDLPPGDPKNESNTLPVPLESTEQCQAPSAQNGEKTPNSISVPRHQIDPLPGDPKISSKSLPVPLEGTEQCPSPSVSNDEKPLNPSLLPGPALVPVPERAHELHSRDPSPAPLPLPSLALLPTLVRKTGPPDHSRSSPKGAASKPVPELVIPTCESLTPLPTASPLSQPATDMPMSNDSANLQLADELTEL